jgi:hypothetical protein
MRLGHSALGTRLMRGLTAGVLGYASHRSGRLRVIRR